MNNIVKKYESFDDIDTDVVSFLSEFQSGKFKRIIKKPYMGNIPNKTITSCNSHDIELIKNDSRYLKTYNFINNLYNIGHGIKSIIKDHKLPITYPVLRKLMIDIMNIKLRKYNDITDVLRLKRSDKVKTEHERGTGWFSDTVVRKQNRGLQGYYFNKSKNKYVWLRSTYEFIYATWLDDNHKIWDIEYKSFRLSDGSLYKPDFFIFNNDDNLIEIIEIKGYWENRSYKLELLKNKLKDQNIKCKLINMNDIHIYATDQ